MRLHETRLSGDFNINLLNADSHVATGDFLHTMMSSGFYPAITKPTGINDFSATLIDNIYCNAPANSLTGIVYRNISEHLPIFIINDTKIKRIKETRSIESRDMGEQNILKLQEKLQNFDWSFINSLHDVDIAYNQFLQAFKNIFDECCPVKIKNIKNNFKKSWMTPALFKSSKTKDKLFKNYQKNPNADNKHKYNSYNNLFTTIKRKAQKFYLNNKFENAKGNLKETWKIIKEVINNNKNNLVMTDSFKFENKLISNAEEISNKFNEFFVTIGPKLDAKIDPPQTDFKSYLPINIRDSFFY